MNIFFMYSYILSWLLEIIFTGDINYLLIVPEQIFLTFEIYKNYIIHNIIINISNRNNNIGCYSKDIYIL